MYFVVHEFGGHDIHAVDALLGVLRYKACKRGSCRLLSHRRCERSLRFVQKGLDGAGVGEVLRHRAVWFQFSSQPGDSSNLLNSHQRRTHGSWTVEEGVHCEGAESCLSHASGVERVVVIP